MSKITQCSGCNQPFTNTFGRLIYPKILNCYHILCNTCINEQISEQNHTIKKIKCVECDICTNIDKDEDLRIDYYTLGLCYHLICSNKNSSNFELENFELDTKPLRIKTVDTTQFRQKYNFDDCIIKCSNCKNTNGRYFVYKDCKVYCERCLQKEDQRIELNENFKRLSKKIYCSEHQNANLDCFCLECQQFVCARCCIKGSHQEHQACDFYTTEHVKKMIPEINDMPIKLKAHEVEQENSVNQLKVETYNKVRKEVMKCNSNLKEIYDRAARDASEIKKKYDEYRDKELFIYQLKNEFEDCTAKRSTLLLDKNSILTSLTSDLNELSKYLSQIDKEKEKSKENNEGNSKKFIKTRTSSFNNNQQINTNGITCNKLKTATCKKQEMKQPKKMSNSDSYNDYHNTNNNKKYYATNMNGSFHEQDFLKHKLPKTDNYKKKKESVAQVKNVTDKEKNAFEIGEITEVKLLHFISVDKFYVRKTSDFVVLASLVSDIDAWRANNKNFEKEEEDDIVTNASIGDIVLYYCNKMSKWVRVKIIDLIENVESESHCASILFIDYGQKEITCVSKFRKMPLNIFKYPELAIRCYFNNVIINNNSRNNENDSQMDTSNPIDDQKTKEQEPNKTIELLLNKWYDYKKNLAAKVNEIGKNGSYGIDFIDPSNELTFSVILSKFKIATLKVNDDFDFRTTKSKFVKMRSLYQGETIQACVSFFTNFNIFYMRQVHSDKEVEKRFLKIYDSMQKEGYNVNSTLLFTPSIGLPCAALFEEDNQWYRAEIVGIRDNLTFDVCYVDFGNVTNIPWEHIRNLKYEFVKFSVDTFKCSLFGISFESPQKEEEASAYFTKLVELSNENGYQQKLFAVKVINITDDKEHQVIISLDIDKRLTNINSLFVKMKYAKGTHPSVLSEVDRSLEREMKQRDAVEMPKMMQKPTILEQEAKEVKYTFNKKTIINKPDDSVLVYISSSISPDEIWVQEATEREYLLDVVKTQLLENYSELSNDDNLDCEWNIGDFCVYKHPRQMQFYRGKIVDIKGKKYKFLCLDTGIYYENVNPECLFEMAASVKKPDFIAKKCSLFGVEPTGNHNSWGSLAKEFTELTLSDKQVLVVYKSDNIIGLNEVQQIEIYIEVDANKEDDLIKQYKMYKEYVTFADMLNKRGLALIKSKKAPSQIKSIKTYLSAELPNNLSQTIDVIFNYIEPNGLIHFYFKKNESIFSNLESSLNSNYSNNKQNLNLKTFESGQACICKTNKKSKINYYRAKIIAIDENCDVYVTVKSIDYGFIEYVHKDDLFEPMHIYLNEPSLSLMLRLQRGTAFYLNETERNHIQALFDRKPCTIRLNQGPSVSMIKSPRTNLCGDLYETNYGSITEYILNLCIKESDHFRQFNCLTDKNIREYHQVSISYVTDLRQLIHVQVYEPYPDYNYKAGLNLDILHNLDQHLKYLYENKKLKNLETRQIKEGAICCTIFEDSLYRALVVKVDEVRGCRVFFVDYGNYCFVNPNFLFELNTELLQLPIQCIPCRLKNITYKNRDNEVIVDKVFTIAESLDIKGSLFAKFYSTDKSNHYQVEFYDGNPKLSDNVRLVYQEFIDSNMMYYEEE